MHAIESNELAGQTVHTFEANGLGKAPFKFIGMNENLYQVAPGIVKPGGCCDYCCNGIRYEYWLLSADGKKFKVGSECIHKSGDSGLRKAISEAEAKIRRERNWKARERRMAKAAASNAVRYAAQLAEMDRLMTLEPEASGVWPRPRSYAKGVAEDMARGLRSGRSTGLSQKQIDFIGRLVAENFPE